jgi:hypothetical protein
MQQSGTKKDTLLRLVAFSHIKAGVLPVRPRPTSDLEHRQNTGTCCGQTIEWPAALASEVARAVADMTHAELSDRLESGSVARHSSPNGAAVAHRMKRGPHLWGDNPTNGAAGLRLRDRAE